MDFIKTKTVLISPYPVEVVLCLLSDSGLNKLGDFEAAKCLRDGMTVFVYFSDDDIPIMVHELFHATEFIMDILGQKLGYPPNETWAYTMEFLTRECMEFLEE